MSRCGPGSPASTRRASSALVAGSPPTRASAGDGAMPRSLGIDARRSRTSPSRSSTTWRRGRGGELVEPVVAVDDQRPLGAPAPRARRPCARPCGVGDADHLPADTGRVGQRAEEVEGGGDAELAPGGTGVAHRGVEPGREAEADAGLGHAAGHLVGAAVDAHAERLEQVGRAGRRRRRPVAVLAHPPAGAGHDERREGRDVDRVGAVAAGADDVDDGSGPRGSSTRSAASSMASTSPASSSTVSPFMRRATMNPAIWAGVAAPSRISAIGAPAAAVGASQVAAGTMSVVRGRAGHALEAPSADAAVDAAQDGAAALADDAAALLLGGAAPDAFLLADAEGVLEAGLPDGAPVADRLGAVGLLVGGRVEDQGVESAAGGVLSPGQLHGGGNVSL